MVKNPSFSAEDTGSNPGQGTKIPHASEQLSLQAATTGLCVTTTESMRCNKRPALCNEDPVCYN